MSNRRPQKYPVKERTANARQLRSVITKPARPHDHGTYGLGQHVPAAAPEPEPEYGRRTQFAWVAPD